jgi:enamine deaminase RidA (YjgF/YER057c/UK114 family)
MTAITPDAVDTTLLRVITFSSVQTRLTHLLEEHPGLTSWWVEVARQLDDLAAAVRTEPGDLVDAEGFTEQIRDDAPHLMSRWMRLSAEREGLYDAVAQVRLQVGRDAGDPTAVEAAQQAIRSLLTRARRFQERTTEVLLDAYERDLGGE